VHENEDTTTTLITGDRKFFCTSHVSTPKACSTLSLDFYSDHNKITKLQKELPTFHPQGLFKLWPV
jgi:hypothetical protein